MKNLLNHNSWFTKLFYMSIGVLLTVGFYVFACVFFITHYLKTDTDAIAVAIHTYASGFFSGAFIGCAITLIMEKIYNAK